MILGVTPWAPPYAYANRRWGNPVRTQRNTVLRQRVVLMMIPQDRRDALWEGWGFRVGTWNADSLTGRAGELVEVLADRKVLPRTI